jgi:ATP-dependent RNA helicase DDX43
MKDPIQVFIGTLDLAAVHSVTQTIEIVEEEEKYALVCILILTFPVSRSN